MTPARVRAAAEDLTSLDERLGLLLPVRVVLALATLVMASAAPDLVGWSATGLSPATAAYLLFASAGELLAIRRRVDRVTVHRLLVPLDAVYLIWATVPVGGSSRVTLAVLAVHLVAVTTLASLRSGLRLALWDGFLLVATRVRWVATTLGHWRGVPIGHAPPVAQTTIAAAGLVAIACCAGFGASVSERELRRARNELRSLTAMAADLELHPDVEGVLRGLLRALAGAFALERAVAAWDDGESVRVGTVSLSPHRTWAQAALARRPRRRSEAGTAQEPSLPGADAAEPSLLGADAAVTTGWDDALAAEAWATRSPQLTRALDPDRDPVLARLLPGSRHVVVLPLGPDRGARGVVAVALGPALIGERLPRRTLLALTQFGAHASLALRNAAHTAERERLARVDGLTGLANRRAFDEVLASELSRSRRSGEPLSLVLVDIDRFKDVNDRRGHQAGDEVLRVVAGVLAATVRRMDTAARYGGEEFAVVLAACGPEGAARVAESIRVAVAAATGPETVTVSAGLASYPANAGSETDLVQAADEALYRSKREGRDRVTVSERLAATAAG